MQFTSMLVSGQRAPPWLALVMTLRERALMPPPQVAVHGPFADQSLTMQLTGQGCVLQAVVSSSLGHSAPPWAG